jgi:hypothetical protein
MSSDGGRTCDESELINIFKKTNSTFFSLSDTLEFNFMRFSRKWCANSFSNVNLLHLKIFEQMIRFFPANITSTFSCYIASLEYYFTTMEFLNKELLHPQVFGQTQLISVVGSIGKVELDVFKDLTSLTILDLRLFNSRGFAHANGVEWMRYFNYYQASFEATLDDNNVTLSNESISSLEQFKVVVIFRYWSDVRLLPSKYFPLIDYQFPDEDLCLFASYPHEKLIFTFVAN